MVMCLPVHSGIEDQEGRTGQRREYRARKSSHLAIHIFGSIKFLESKPRILATGLASYGRDVAVHGVPNHILINPALGTF